ncbi:hypothetical protein E2562_000664 [Oryza meyeriana var. granulata]|uniref:Uncharacterized protein n=1 Tax=Oryza meyeriana var. granulata TaxID=110450 RepID=A0A6G1DT69_9ORYZ|nr:hypothetical protein E2562_000664 [Oryza meyeriana var. granulata]
MFRYQKGGDVEAGTSGTPSSAAGARELYSGMTEPPEMRWALIRKIYIILSMQQLLTAAVVVKVLELAGNAARTHTHARPPPLASL